MLEHLPQELINIIKYYVLESPHKKELLKKIPNIYNLEIIYNWNSTSEVLTCYNKQKDLYTVFSHSIIIMDYELPERDQFTNLTQYIVYLNYLYEEY